MPRPMRWLRPAVVDRLGRAGLTAFGLIAVAVVAVACIFATDCAATPGILRAGWDAGGPTDVTLDAKHPVAEQPFTVHANAEALPEEYLYDAVLEIQLWDTSTGRISNPETGMTEADLPEITVIDGETGMVVPAAQPNTKPDRFLEGGDRAATVPLDCPLGQACDRTYRLRVAAPNLDPGATLTVSWRVMVQIRYAGLEVEGCQSGPVDAELTLDIDEAVRIPAEQVASTSTAQRTEAVGAIVARHVTLTSDLADPSAALRLGILQEPGHLGPWVRVVPDGSMLPVADAEVGAQYQEGEDRGPATLDAPILEGCVGSVPCERGYWIVFQHLRQLEIRDGAQALRQLTWAADGTATYPPGTDATDALRITTYQPFVEVSEDVVAVASSDAVRVPRDGTDAVIEAVITVPARPPMQRGLDPLVTSAVIVNWAGDPNGHIQTRVQGPGTYGERLVSGIGFVTHPLDACPPTGPCEVRLQLKAERFFSPGEERVETDGTTPVEWRVRVVGAPAGTEVRFETGP